MKRDPVCYMLVDESRAGLDGLVSNFQGQTYHFCSEQCKQKFDDTPVIFTATFPDWESIDSDLSEGYAGDR